MAAVGRRLRWPRLRVWQRTQGILEGERLLRILVLGHHVWVYGEGQQLMRQARRDAAKEGWQECEA